MFSVCGITRRGLTSAQNVVPFTSVSFNISTHTPVRHFWGKKKVEEKPQEPPPAPVPTKQSPRYSTSLRHSETTPTKLGEDLKKRLPWFIPEWLILKQVKWDYMYEHCRDQAERMIKGMPTRYPTQPCCKSCHPLCYVSKCSNNIISFQYLE